MKLGEKPGSRPNQALHGDFEMLVIFAVIFTIWPGAKVAPLVEAVIRTAEGAQRGGFGLVVVVTVRVVAVAADGRTTWSPVRAASEQQELHRRFASPLFAGSGNLASRPPRP
jgi:hypothetical protein